MNGRELSLTIDESLLARRDCEFNEWGVADASTTNLHGKVTIGCDTTTETPVI